MKKKILLSAVLLLFCTVLQAQVYPAVLKIGPLGSAPAYFYIDTKIPCTDIPAPQIHIRGYHYGNANKAIDLTISWYYYAGSFYWTQYKSDLGYYNPSRIRLGTYDDAGTTRIRIEIANDGAYWSGYSVSAFDSNWGSIFYSGWSYTLGEMPSGTGNIVTLGEYPGIVYSNTGNVGIGTTTPAEKLSVNGKIRAKEVKVEVINWPDYVFEEGYELEELEGLEKFIQVNKHLPEVPSAVEVEREGINLGEMNAKLLKKIEELTLYMIQQNKLIHQQIQRIEILENENLKPSK